MGVIGYSTLIKFNWFKQDAGHDRMKETQQNIADGAMAFLKAEWKILGYFAVMCACCLVLWSRSETHALVSIAMAFVIGVFFSALAGFIRYEAATKANVRTTHAARTKFSKALSVSFLGGSVMGYGFVALCLGLGGVLFILKIFAPRLFQLHWR
jgi:K(+)-stimulated pyrophosphate-energized sodium pump